MVSKLNMIDMYGIKVGQKWVAASGSGYQVTVLDVESYAYCDDVVVTDGMDVYRIDAFKLAAVRYKLVESVSN